MQQIITEILFPRKCPVCDRIVVPWGDLCCPGCRSRLQYLGENYCMKCGKGLSKEEWEFCTDCKKHRHYFERGRSLYAYESVAASIFRLKYRGRQEYADFFGEELYQHLYKDIAAMQAQAILPVPLHRTRMRERGFNQSALLAKALAKRCGIPYRGDLVIRSRKTLPQKQLNYSERQNNLKKAFKLSGNDVKLDTAIIMDDIYTTGSTVDAMSEALLAGGLKRVYVITLAAGTE